MTILSLLLPHIVSLTLGALTLRSYYQKTKIMLPWLIWLSLSWGIGLGLSGLIVYLSLIVFHQFHRSFILIIHMLLILGLAYQTFHQTHWSEWRKDIKPFLTCKYWPELLVVLTLLAFSAYYSLYYLHGGWDAWSVWNFKARMIFLSGQNWTHIFEPVLWRSSPHYPLLLPLINCWGWIFQREPHPLGPWLTAILFTSQIALLLWSGLLWLTRCRWACLPAFLVLSQPLIHFFTNQYAEVVMAYYLLAIFFCLTAWQKYQHPSWLKWAGLMTGLISFVKPEGFVAAGIIGLLLLLNGLKSFWQTRRLPKHYVPFFLCLLIGCLATLSFKLFYAPANQTMTNGLLSVEQPSTFERMHYILYYYSVHLFAPIWHILKYVLPPLQNFHPPTPWNGLWLVVVGAFLCHTRRCLQDVMGFIFFFLIFFFSILTVYYWVNTHFEIQWWLQVTLTRICGSLIPLVCFWLFYSYLTNSDHNNDKAL